MIFITRTSISYGGRRRHLQVMERHHWPLFGHSVTYILQWANPTPAGYHFEGCLGVAFVRRKDAEAFKREYLQGGVR